MGAQNFSPVSGGGVISLHHTHIGSKYKISFIEPNSHNTIQNGLISLKRQDEILRKSCTVLEAPYYKKNDVKSCVRFRET